MCITIWNSVSEVKEIVKLLEKSFFVLGETGCGNRSSYAWCSQKQYGPTCHGRMPVVDLCEDG